MPTITRNFADSQINVTNSDAVKIIKHYAEPSESAPVVSSEVDMLTPEGQEAAAQAPKASSETYESSEAALSSEVSASVTEQAVTENKLSRRDAFKRASEMERKAQEKEKLANQKLAKAKEFEQLLEKAKADPTIISQAFGVDPAEFLRQYQNQMFNIKDEPVKTELTPEQIRDQRIERLEQERVVEQARLQQEQIVRMEMQKNSIKSKYVETSILPVLSKDLEKFQMINAEGEEARNQWASYLYDIMNDHYCKTCSKHGANDGEIININDLAETLEERLTADAEDKLEKARKLPKFSNRFKDSTSASSYGTPKTVSSSMAKTSSGGLPSKQPVLNKEGAKVVQRQFLTPREAKLAETKRKIAEMFDGKE